MNKSQLLTTHLSILTTLLLITLFVSTTFALSGNIVTSIWEIERVEDPTDCGDPITSSIFTVDLTQDFNDGISFVVPVNDKYSFPFPQIILEGTYKDDLITLNTPPVNYRDGIVTYLPLELTFSEGCKSFKGDHTWIASTNGVYSCRGLSSFSGIRLSEGGCVDTKPTQTSCSNGQSLCGEGETAKCLDTGFDLDNCGGCGNVCPTGALCQSGQCGCPTGKEFCGTYEEGCIDITTNVDNCGQCGTVCKIGDICNEGKCEDQATISNEFVCSGYFGPTENVFGEISGDARTYKLAQRDGWTCKPISPTKLSRLSEGTTYIGKQGKVILTNNFGLEKMQTECRTDVTCPFADDRALPLLSGNPCGEGSLISNPTQISCFTTTGGGWCGGCPNNGGSSFTCEYPSSFGEINVNLNVVCQDCWLTGGSYCICKGDTSCEVVGLYTIAYECTKAGEGTYEFVSCEETSVIDTCKDEGQILCGDVCADPSTDLANCGGCGNICPSGSICQRGQCLDSATRGCSPPFIYPQGFVCCSSPLGQEGCVPVTPIKPCPTTCPADISTIPDGCVIKSECAFYLSLWASWSTTNWDTTILESFRRPK